MNTLKHILCIGLLWCLAMTASAIEFPTYQPRINEATHSQIVQGVVQTKRHGTFTSPFKYDISGTMSSTSSYAPRRIKSNGDGSYHGEKHDGQYWDDDEGEWVDELVEGMLQIQTNGGTTNTYRWNGSSWELVSSIADPNQPIGSLPFLLMLLLCGGYVVVKKRKQAKLARFL